VRGYPTPAWSCRGTRSPMCVRLSKRPTDSRTRPLACAIQGTHPGSFAVRSLAPDMKADPLPRRSARRRQNVHRKVHRQGDGEKLCAPVPGRRARRIGYPRAPQDVHRLHARPHHRRHAALQIQESADASRRSGQTGREHAGGSLRRAAQVSDSDRTTPSRDHFIELPFDLSRCCSSPRRSTPTRSRRRSRPYGGHQKSLYTREEKFHSPKSI
jgi:hypothetical protein